MTRRPVRPYHSDRQIPPRVFDVIVEGKDVDIEVKYRKTYVTIPWREVEDQVNLAIEEEKRKVSK